MTQVITSNVFSIFLDKNFYITKFTIYSFITIMLSVASCGLIIKTTENKNFIDVILNGISKNDKQQINQKVLEEWECNKKLYEVVTKTDKSKSTELILNNYNKVLLVVLSKVLL